MPEIKEAATLLTTRAYELRILDHSIEFRSSGEASAAENLDVSILGCISLRLHYLEIT